MLIDTEHLHYWMCAIRQSKNSMRTLDAFWQGQMTSKEWLINYLKGFVHSKSSVDIYGGWVGVLSSMLFQSPISITTIRSIDIDPDCEEIATTMNKIEHMAGRFRAITSDMCNLRSDADVVINTSCEHITQDQYDEWLTCLPYNSLIVLQSNNYDAISEHIRTAKTLDEFKNQSKIETILYAGQLETQLYTRWMIIGKQ